MSRRSLSTKKPLFEVVWPLGRFVSKPVELAAAVLDLNGKTVCELWDDVFRGDQIYAVLNEELRKKFPDITIVEAKTLGNIHGVHEREYVANLPDLLQQHGSDAVISAVGA